MESSHILHEFSYVREPMAITQIPDRKVEKTQDDPAIFFGRINCYDVIKEPRMSFERAIHRCGISVRSADYLETCLTRWNRNCRG